MDDRELEAYLYNRHDRPLAESAREPRAPEDDALRRRDVRIPTADGFALAATVFEHEATSVGPRRVVLVASATGVKQRYYAPFAAWLASVGFTVVTFDYRGIGGSRDPSSGARVPATMHAWGARDLAAAVAWSSALAANERIALVGHSVGGQLIGLLPDVSRIRAVVTVASQSGDYRLWPMPLRLAMAALWYGVIPGITHAMGYLPGSLGIGEDLPAGVALEWARWCRTPGYLAAEDPSAKAGYARVDAPMLAFGFHDDTYAPPAAVDALLALYTRAKVTRRRLGPADGQFGHFGFFRSQHRALWRELASFLVDTLD